MYYFDYSLRRIDIISVRIPVSLMVLISINIKVRENWSMKKVVALRRDSKKKSIHILF